MNPISHYWLKRRQAIARNWIKNSIVLDIGSRSERLVPDSIAIDIERCKGIDIQADARYLPFRPGIADYILGLELIEHFDYNQLTLFLTEAKRVGKTTILSTPNCGLSWIFFWEIWKRIGGRTWHDAHLSQFQNRFLLSLFKEFNFDITNSKVTRWSLFYQLSPRSSR